MVNINPAEKELYHFMKLASYFNVDVINSIQVSTNLMVSLQDHVIKFGDFIICSKEVLTLIKGHLI